MKTIVLTADNLKDEDAAIVRDASSGIGAFTRWPQESPEGIDAVRNADIVIGWTDPTLLRDGKPTLYLCGSAGIDAYLGVGLDHKPGFRMTNACGVMSVTIAEHCVAMMFAVVRQFPQMIRQQLAKQYARRWHGGEVAGSTACIVGLGGSGVEIAKRLSALGLSVTGVRRDVSQPPPPGVSKVYPPDAMHEAIAKAQHVFCLVPGGASTRHMFNAATFRRMRRGAFFYNASRGTTVDEQALVETLASGHLGGAGLDVFEHEPLATVGDADAVTVEADVVELDGGGAARRAVEVDAVLLVVLDLAVAVLVARPAAVEVDAVQRVAVAMNVDGLNGRGVVDSLDTRAVVGLEHVVREVQVRGTGVEKQARPVALFGVQAMQDAVVGRPALGRDLGR